MVNAMAEGMVEAMAKAMAEAMAEATAEATAQAMAEAMAEVTAKATAAEALADAMDKATAKATAKAMAKAMAEATVKASAKQTAKTTAEVTAASEDAKTYLLTNNYLGSCGYCIRVKKQFDLEIISVSRNNQLFLAFNTNSHLDKNLEYRFQVLIPSSVWNLNPGWTRLWKVQSILSHLCLSRSTSISSQICR